MSKQVRFRRGTTAQHSVFTGPSGEITVDTDKKQIVVHDGVTAGGVPVAREDRPRGLTKYVYLTTSDTSYSISGKTDLKRIRVYASGGGGGNVGSEGGQGLVTIEVGSLSTTTSVTIGAGGSSAGTTGGTTSFGTFISCTGGAGSGGSPGAPSGTGVINLGSQHCQPTSSAGSGAGRGGGIGGGGPGQVGKSYTGGGGGSSAAGGSGGIIIEEIYGYV